MYIDVPSVDEYVDKVKKLGGQVVLSQNGRTRHGILRSVPRSGK